MSSHSELRLEWCSRAAAKYACERWHYSRCIPASKSEYVGVWEAGKFIGAILFGGGAGNITKGSVYGLQPMQMAELTRVALDKHSAPVSRVVSVALRMLKRRSPGIRLVVSLADPVRGHVGSIYQAGGWLYVGTTAKSKTYIGRSGREYHQRVVSSSGRIKQYGRYVPCLRPEDAASIRENPGKHKYLMPLDDAMRAQIEPLRKPYPKRPKQATTGDQPARGGAAPTRTLQHSSAAPDAP